MSPVGCRTTGECTHVQARMIPKMPCNFWLPYGNFRMRALQNLAIVHPRKRKTGQARVNRVTIPDVRMGLDGHPGWLPRPLLHTVIMLGSRLLALRQDRYCITPLPSQHSNDVLLPIQDMSLRSLLTSHAIINTMGESCNRAKPSRPTL